MTDTTDTTELPYGFACPHCGFTGDRDAANDWSGHFRYIESVVEWRSIDRPTEAGVLPVGASSGYYDAYGDDARIECRNCLDDFEIPKDMEINWL